ncbi:MAG: pullulanase-type alpha-1,6-glucosidase [Opitutales bacterium]
MHFRPVFSATLLFAFLGAAAAPTESPFALGVSGDFAETVSASHRGTPSDARAIWLDARHVRWSVPAGTVRVRLLGSSDAGLQVAPGTPAGGAPIALALEPSAPPVLTEAARFSHVTGATWRVPEAEAVRLPELWRGQLLIVAEDAQGRVLDATGTQLAGALDARYAAAAASLEFGAHPMARGTSFLLWAPTARSVRLCLYDNPSAPARAILPMDRDATSGSWRLISQEDWRGKFYTFLVEVFVPGTGLVRNQVTDPYSLSLCADSRRSAVVDLNDPATMPDAWAADRRPDTIQASTDLVVYELQVRDFSRDDTSVTISHRGKYLAFTHADSAGMRHLRNLAAAGVTDVHLLPTFDFSSVPERNAVTPEYPKAAPDSPAVQAALAPVRDRDLFNWGYDPWHYNAPEGSYATDPDDAVERVREFRAMVQSLHRTGLRVGLDVVYNHATADGQKRQSVLDRIVPGYYHRLDANGRVEASTCNSNTAAENALMAKLVIDSALVWARDYRVDSFRFDLMGHLPRAVLERLQAAVDAATGRHIHLLGEGWNYGEVQNGARFVQASQLSLQHSGIATFSDRMRDAARGGRAGDSGEALHAQGWLNGLSYAPNAANTGRDTTAELGAAADLVRVGLAGSLRDFPLQGADGRTRPLAEFAYGDQPAGYVAEPGEVVNYVENHDNQTLFDNNVMRLPADTPRSERARVQVVGNALVLFSQGIAYLHAGQEMLRSKSLDRNSFNSGDVFNRIDWTLNTNYFGTGLPPAWDNESSWPQMQPLLARMKEIAPTSDDIRFTWAATLDLLRIRRSSALFRLRTAADVKQRLRFLNTGPGARPSVLIAHLEGRGCPGAGFAEVLYALNADVTSQVIALPAEASKPWVLHPVQAAATAGDPRAREAGFDPAAGTLTVPARTAVVFVIPD